jgi:raffinose/stachyose/melibiose transport system permease protein
MKKANPVLRVIAIVAILAVFLAPFWILTTISFKPSTDTSSYWLFSSTPTMNNIKAAIDKAGIFGAIGRTAFITVCVVVLEVIVSAFAAYPLARRNTKFNKVVQAFILGIMMVPPLSILVSLYSIIVSIHGVNQYWAVILVLLTYQLPQGIFLYANFIRSIPVALDEAATIDGCGPGRTFFLVIMPQLKPVTATVAILSSVNCWNDFQFSRYILQTNRMNTVTLSISSFFSQTYIDLSTATACALIAILPVVICFLILQKYFIQGMIDSSVK